MYVHAIIHPSIEQENAFANAEPLVHLQEKEQRSHPCAR
jgi:hypothetical protein